MSKRILSLIAALSVGLLLASPALAVSFTVQIGEGAAVDLVSTGAIYTDVESGVTFWWLEQGGAPVDPNNPYTGIEGLEITGMSAALKEDPFVTNNISFINTTAFTQTYTITVTLPIPSFAYNATVASSVGVTVTDGPGGGATGASVSPDGIFTGLVNGSTALLTLLPHPSSATCATTGCSDTELDNSGLPLIAVAPGFATSIGIELKFTLSPGDQVGITSRFEIVPEPSLAALLGLGFAALALGIRRSG